MKEMQSKNRQIDEMFKEVNIEDEPKLKIVKHIAKCMNIKQ